MKQVSVTEVQSELLQLIESVETSGEPISIVRDGLSVVEIVPSRMSRQARATAAMERWLEIRKGMPSIPEEEWMQWRHEGHKY